MENKKHTPGPWKVKHSESKEAYNVVGTHVGQLYKICQCLYMTTESMPNVSEKNKLESEANAKLIAAAPDMLKFIMEMAEIYENSPWISGEANKLIKQVLE